MHPRSIAALLSFSLAAAVAPAQADDADDLAEVARMQARLRAEVPAGLRVFQAEFGSGATLLLRGPKTSPQQAWIESGSDWVELKPSGYTGLNCRTSGIAITEFALEAGMRAYFKARTIAQEQGAQPVDAGQLSFEYRGASCEPGWYTTLSVKGTRHVHLRFDPAGGLADVWEWQDGQQVSLDAAEVRALDARATTVIPSVRAEAEPLPAEAEIAEPTGDEYLVASIAGQAYTCATDDIHLLYDYYRIELRCEGDATPDPLMVTAVNVPPGKSEHYTVPGMAGPTLWTRQGLVQMESDSPGDTRVWIDTLAPRLVEGRFEGTVTNASGKRVKIANGRFRLLPGEGFRVTPE